MTVLNGNLNIHGEFFGGHPVTCHMRRRESRGITFCMLNLCAKWWGGVQSYAVAALVLRKTQSPL